MIRKHSYILMRIGAGLSVMGSLTWVLWDGVQNALDPEPIFVFSGAFVAWVISEFRGYHQTSSQNDIRLAKLLMTYRTYQMRTLFADHDFGSSIEQKYYSEFYMFLDAIDRGKYKFQNKALQKDFNVFVNEFRQAIDLIAKYTIPHTTGNIIRIYVKPVDATWGDKYHKEINEINETCTEVWNTFESFMNTLDKEIPELRDDEILFCWYFADQN